jgi:Flp pilus assembly protein TadD
MGAQDYASAVTAFRKATFLDPDQPVAYLSLGLALEAVGDLAPAQRAYAAARACVDRCDTAAIETTLEGYHWDEFTRLLDLKSGSR